MKGFVCVGDKFYPQNPNPKPFTFSHSSIFPFLLSPTYTYTLYTPTQFQEWRAYSCRARADTPWRTDLGTV